MAEKMIGKKAVEIKRSYLQGVGRKGSRGLAEYSAPKEG